MGSGSNNRSASSSPNHGYAISPVTQHYPQSPLVLPASPLASNCPGGGPGMGPPEFPTSPNGSTAAAASCLGYNIKGAPPSPRTPDSCSPPPSPIVPLANGSGGSNSSSSAAAHAGESSSACGSALGAGATHSPVFDMHKYAPMNAAAMAANHGGHPVAPMHGGGSRGNFEQQQQCHFQHSSSPTASPFLTPIKSRLNSLKNSFLGSPTFHRRKHPSKFHPPPFVFSYLISAYAGIL